MSEKKSVEKTVREIRHKTRKKYTAEEKIRIVLEGLRGESTIAEVCRREGINTNMYYKWSKEFLDAGKERGKTVYFVHPVHCFHRGCTRFAPQIWIGDAAFKSAPLKGALFFHFTFDHTLR